MKDVVIVGALRTPIGCFQGTLSRHSAVELGSLVVKALVERTGICLLYTSKAPEIGNKAPCTNEVYFGRNFRHYSATRLG